MPDREALFKSYSGLLDVTAATTIGTPKEQSETEHAHQTQFFLFTFDGDL